MSEYQPKNGGREVFEPQPRDDAIPGLIPGTDQYEEMRVPSKSDEVTRWVVHLADGGSETVPGAFTFRTSSGMMIFHEWGAEQDGRRERKARYIFPMSAIKFVQKINV
jgi:hypothetical protein